MGNHDIVSNVSDTGSSANPKFSRSHTDRMAHGCRSDRNRPGSKTGAVKTQRAAAAAHPEISVFCLRNPKRSVRKESVLYSPCSVRVLGEALVRIQCVRRA